MKTISKMPYAPAGKMLGFVRHYRDERDPKNPFQALAGRDWYEALSPSGEKVTESNSRKLCQDELRKRAAA